MSQRVPHQAAVVKTAGPEKARRIGVFSARIWGQGSDRGAAARLARSVRLGTSMTHHTLALRHGLFLSAMFTVVAAECVGGPEEEDEHFANMDLLLNANVGSGRWRFVAGVGLGFAFLDVRAGSATSLRIPAQIGFEVLSKKRGFGFGRRAEVARLAERPGGCVQGAAVCCESKSTLHHHRAARRPGPTPSGGSPGRRRMA